MVLQLIIIKINLCLQINFIFENRDSKKVILEENEGAGFQERLFLKTMY